MKHLIWVIVLGGSLCFMVLKPPGLRAGTRPSPGPDVDLVKLQKQEEERRKNAPKPKYSFTDEDLKKMKSSSEKVAITKAASQDQSAEKKIENKGVQAKNPQTQASIDTLKTESQWRQEKNRIQAEIKIVEIQLKQEEEKLIQLKTRLDVQGIDMLSEQLLVEKQINQLTEATEGYKSDIEALKNELENLYEKARREGIPPGWLRD
jgi:hypothetical protein